jgi:hypothetical protein
MAPADGKTLLISDASAEVFDGLGCRPKKGMPMDEKRLDNCP